MLRLVVLPEAGAKVWQIHYKPLACRSALESPFSWPGAAGVSTLPMTTRGAAAGMSCFPTMKPGELLGYKLPDHGELWTGEWQAEPDR